jgi:hypothetical protein
MPIPNKVGLIDKIVLNLPAELLDAKIWLAYYYQKNKDGTYTKPPCAQQGHSVDEDKEGATFWDAVRDGYPGIKINKHTNLIAFDVDDKEAKTGKRKFDMSRLSKEFQDFMVKHDSYTEISPSGCGVRILMYCEDKEGLPGRTNLSKELCIGGELFMNSGYVTITGDQIAGESIKTIKAEELKKWYGTAKVVEFPKPKQERSDIPSLSLTLDALNSCFLDQRERVIIAYKTIIGQDYNHYDYWLKIMAACHNYAIKSGQMVEMVSAVVEWSQTDEKAFESEENVIKHWSSFSQKESGITYHTLFKFAQMLKFQWPEEAYDKQGKPTGKPLVNSYENFQYMADYYNIKLHQDVFSGLLYVTADKEILKRYFFGKETSFGMVGPYSLDELKYKFWLISQKNGYINITFSTISPLFGAYWPDNIKSVNMMKAWLETPPEELARDMVEKDTDISKSNLDYLMSCIKFKETQDKGLAKKYFDTFFFEMMMPIYNVERKYSQRSFMLVLTGPENCRKTTFFSMLFPANLRRQFVTNSTETLGGAKSVRDFAMSLVTSALVVIDEFEIFYNQKNDSLFKTYVTSDVIDYVPIYEKTLRKEYKNAVLAGTTNRRSLAFEQDSNRRLAIIDVSFINTTAMECINWHHFYRHYIDKGKKAMMNGIHPWKLSDEVIKEQYRVNEEFRSQSNLEIILRETFDFDMKTHKQVIKYDTGGIQTNKELLKMSDILGAIQQRYPTLSPKPAELKHLLKRLCGSYTHTTNLQRELFNCKGFIENGIIKQGQWTRYVVPPKLTDFD